MIRWSSILSSSEELATDVRFAGAGESTVSNALLEILPVEIEERTEDEESTLVRALSRCSGNVGVWRDSN